MIFMRDECSVGPLWVGAKRNGEHFAESCSIEYDKAKNASVYNIVKWGVTVIRCAQQSFYDVYSRIEQRTL